VTLEKERLGVRVYIYPLPVLIHVLFQLILIEFEIEKPPIVCNCGFLAIVEKYWPVIKNVLFIRHNLSLSELETEKDFLTHKDVYILLGLLKN